MDVNKLFRSWADERIDPSNKLQWLEVVAKDDVIDRLYGGRCPIAAEKPLKRADVPRASHPFMMQAADLDEVFRMMDRAPRSFLEIGTFHGDTAILIAKNYRIPVTCIDTWLGDLGMWTNPDPKSFLNQGKSIPPAQGFYRKFCGNVAKNSMESYVTPVRLPSAMAIRLLKMKRLKFDAVYIDGSHDYMDVYMDIMMSSSILSPDGLIFGDDYHIPSVAEAVDDFCKETNSEVTLLPKTVFNKSRDRNVKRTYWVLTSPTFPDF